MIAVRGGKLFDGERFFPGPVTVIIDGGRISRVEQGSGELSDDAEVVDYGEATLLPGLIDTHVHLIADSQFGALDRVPAYDDDQLETVINRSLRDQLAAGVTTVRDLGDRGFAVVRHRDGGRAGRHGPEPTVVAAGPPITTPGGHCHFLGGEVDGEAALRVAVADRVERGVDVIKVMASGGGSTPGTDMLRSQFSAEQLRLVVDLAHEAGLPVTAHAHGLLAIEQAVDAGVDGIEHLSGMIENGVDVPDGVVAAIAERGIAISGLIPIPAGMDLTLAPRPIQEFAARTGLTPTRLRAFRVDLVRRLHANGVTVVNGIDSGLSPHLAHGRLHTGLAMFVEAGLPSAEVLAASTSRAAAVCRLDDRKGHLRAGYDADLMVVDADLEDDPLAVEQVAAVFCGGVLVSG